MSFFPVVITAFYVNQILSYLLKGKIGTDNQ